jgi:ATP-binding cassette, subfamily F, member 3
MEQKIGHLSGGQKSRVAFAMVTFVKPHVLVMDEPSSHLDLETNQALVDALRTFPGAVVMVSHDQYLLENVCTEFWALQNKQITIFRSFETTRNYCFK